MNKKNRTRLEAVLRFFGRAKNKKFAVCVLLIVGFFATPMKCGSSKGYFFDKGSFIIDLINLKKQNKKTTDQGRLE